MVFDEEKPFSGQLSGKIERAKRARRAYGSGGSGTQKNDQGFSQKDPRQRAIVKVSYVTMRSEAGRQKARAHLKYLEREGVSESGERGELFGAVPGVKVDRKEFLERADADPHMFRVIISPELGGRMDLEKYAREFMQTVECDRGSKLEWCGVAHYNTDHPHVHLVIRGVQANGQELRFERPYIQETMREHARDIATLELGPRSASQVLEQQRGEIEKLRWTDLDRIIEREFARDVTAQRESARQLKLESAMFARDEEVSRNVLKRLQFLEKMELATRVSAGTWEVGADNQETLKAYGKQHDIQKRLWEARVEQGTSVPLVPGEKVEGKLVGRGLADEVKGTEYVIISELGPGKARYIELEREREYERVRVGEIVTLTRGPEPQGRVVVQGHGTLLAQQTAHHPTWLDRQPQEVAQSADRELKRAMELRTQHIKSLGVEESDPSRRVAQLARVELGDWLSMEQQRRELHKERALVPAHQASQIEGRVNPELVRLKGSLHVLIEGVERDTLVPATRQLQALRGQQVEASWERADGAARAQLVVRVVKAAQVETVREPRSPMEANKMHSDDVAPREIARSPGERLEHAEKVEGKVLEHGVRAGSRASEYIVVYDLSADKTRTIELERERGAERIRQGEIVTLVRSPEPQGKVDVQQHGSLRDQISAAHVTWLDHQSKPSIKSQDQELLQALERREQYLKTIGIDASEPDKRMVQLARVELDQWLGMEQQRRAREHERALVPAHQVTRIEGRVSPELVRLNGSVHVVVEGRERDTLVPATKQLWELRGQQVEGRWQNQEGGERTMVVRASKNNEVER